MAVVVAELVVVVWGWFEWVLMFVLRSVRLDFVMNSEFGIDQELLPVAVLVVVVMTSIPFHILPSNLNILPGRSHPVITALPIIPISVVE